MKQIQLTFAFLLILSGSLSAQNQTIDLWKGQVPGAIPNENYQQKMDAADSWIEKKFFIEPTLNMYPAPAEKANSTAVIICPGVAFAHEGIAVARWFNSLGVTAFVLKYRLPDDAIMKDKSVGPVQDGQEGIRTVRRHAKEWGIDPHKTNIMGFSAGGHLTPTLSTHFNEKVYDPSDNTSARPDFSLLIYPVLSTDKDIAHMESRNNLLGENPSTEQVNRFSNEIQVSSEIPPAFLIHSMDDGIVPVQNSIGYALALEKHHIPCELHIYQSGGYGYVQGKSDNSESLWPKCRK